MEEQNENITTDPDYISTDPDNSQIDPEIAPKPKKKTITRTISIN